MLETSIFSMSRIVESRKNRFPLFPGYEKIYKKHFFKYFKDQDKLILNRGPYNINSRTEFIKIQLKIWNFN